MTKAAGTVVRRKRNTGAGNVGRKVRRGKKEVKRKKIRKGKKEVSGGCGANWTEQESKARGVANAPPTRNNAFAVPGSGQSNGRHKRCKTDRTGIKFQTSKQCISVHFCVRRLVTPEGHYWV